MDTFSPVRLAVGQSSLTNTRKAVYRIKGLF